MTNKRLVWYLEMKRKQMTGSLALENKEAQQMQYKKTPKNSQQFHEKTVAIFYDIEKAYDEINKEKILEQL